MSSSTDLPIIVVLGATGHQGGGVVRELLKSGKWHVRAGTRDTSTTKAKKLLAEGSTADGRLELVTIHPYQIETLRRAFAGAYGVFALTCEAHPDKKLTHEDEMTHEIEAGRYMVQAAEECNVQHFVFSSLPDMAKTTSGRYPKLYHMNNKHAVEVIARERLQQRVTCLIPGFFYTNLQWPQYSRRLDDGVVRFCCPIPSNQVAQWTDPEHDMGTFTAKVFELGPDRAGGKTFYPLSDSITPQQMAETFTRVTGQKAIHEPTSVEEFGDLTAPLVGPPFKEDAMQMMQWAAETPSDTIAYGAKDNDSRSAEHLGLAASSFEEWLKRTCWTGPSRG